MKGWEDCWKINGKEFGVGRFYVYLCMLNITSLYMSLVREIVFQNNQGRLGDRVYRVINGRTFSSRYPVYKKGRKRSKKQCDNNAKFRDATVYAKRVMIDPTLRRKYEVRAKALQNAWNLAIQDYMLRHRDKRVKGVDTSEWEELLRSETNFNVEEMQRVEGYNSLIDNVFKSFDECMVTSELHNPGG